MAVVIQLIYFSGRYISCWEYFCKGSY